MRNEDYNPYDPDSKEYIPLEINSKLYQGTAGEIDVKFDGYRFATKNSDMTITMLLNVSLLSRIVRRNHRRAE